MVKSKTCFSQFSSNTDKRLKVSYVCKQPFPSLHIKCRSITHHYKRSSKFSTQCKCVLYSHFYWLSFFLRPIASAQCWRGRGGKIIKMLRKKHKFHIFTSIRLFFCTVQMNVRGEIKYIYHIRCMKLIHFNLLFWSRETVKL